MNMRDEEVRSARSVRAEGGVCIVMVCADMSEADQVGRQLLELNRGCLVTYRRAEELMLNAPADRVALVILAGDESPGVLRRMLKWLRRRQPQCSITVIGNEGCGQHEMAARQGAANYFTRPVDSRQWAALLAHALSAPARVTPARHDERI
ncbi:MAG: hypothetical protein J7M14_06475 [Planctomycetes bacterium]|nr:hypothetical protein [Planctomycetota bacterium]